MKKLFIIIGALLILTAVYAVSIIPFNPNLTKDFKRLPDNLTPYCCGEVINNRCTGKVDLDRAVLDIEKGMNPAFVYDVDKSSLNCGVDD